MKHLQETKLKYSIKAGDVVCLGEHRLVCGDATDTAIVEKLCQDNKISLILTDPPYGVAYVEGKQDFYKQTHVQRIIKNDHMQSDADYTNWSSLWIDACKTHLAEKNSYYIFNTGKMIFALRDSLATCGYKVSQLLIWIKSQAVIGRKDYLPQHELICFGWKGRHAFYKAKDKSILFYPKPKNNKLHPTMKPVGLLRRLILNSSQVGDYVYDPFGGSGSTLIAAEQTKRRALLIELDPHYCEVIIDRYKQHTGDEVIHNGIPI